VAYILFLLLESVSVSEPEIYQTLVTNKGYNKLLIQNRDLRNASRASKFFQFFDSISNGGRYISDSKENYFINTEKTDQTYGQKCLCLSNHIHPETLATDCINFLNKVVVEPHNKGDVSDMFKILMDQNQGRNKFKIKTLLLPMDNIKETTEENKMLDLFHYIFQNKKEAIKTFFQKNQLLYSSQKNLSKDEKEKKYLEALKLQSILYIVAMISELNGFCSSDLDFVKKDEYKQKILKKMTDFLNSNEVKHILEINNVQKFSSINSFAELDNIKQQLSNNISQLLCFVQNQKTNFFYKHTNCIQTINQYFFIDLDINTKEDILNFIDTVDFTAQFENYGPMFVNEQYNHWETNITQPKRINCTINKQWVNEIKEYKNQLQPLQQINPSNIEEFISKNIAKENQQKQNVINEQQIMMDTILNENPQESLPELFNFLLFNPQSKNHCEKFKFYNTYSLRDMFIQKIILFLYNGIHNVQWLEPIITQQNFTLLDNYKFESVPFITLLQQFHNILNTLVPWIADENLQKEVETMAKEMANTEKFIGDLVVNNFVHDHQLEEDHLQTISHVYFINIFGINSNGTFNIFKRQPKSFNFIDNYEQNKTYVNIFEYGTPGHFSELMFPIPTQ
jgi:hypothetical protein